MKKQKIIQASRLDSLVDLFNGFAKPILVPIAGGSCSGKGFVARRIADIAAQRNMRAAMMPLDNYFRNSRDPLAPYDAFGRRLFDVPEAFHRDEYREHVWQLVCGKPVWIPAYDIKTNARVAHCGAQVEPAELIVADGLFTIDLLAVMHPQTLGVYVEASEYVRVSRRIVRDTHIYGVTEETVRDGMREKVLPCHALYVEPQKIFADIVVCNDQEL